MENFIVSARKYRPATFASVVGQNHITSTLSNAISRGQLAHAYLFCGPRGVGKTTCARIFAKTINCMNPRTIYKMSDLPDVPPKEDRLEACGECESCRSFDEGRSFNIHELDAASNNSVEDIRNLTDQVRIPPQVGRYSVYIIDEVHMLSAAAFNAFLKTLEEPPAHAVFILATTEKHKIIPTILSRCQIFDFNRIRVSDGVDYMKLIASAEGVSYDEESLNLIARKADGGMRDALSMFDKAVSFCGNELRYKEVATSLNILDRVVRRGVELVDRETAPLVEAAATLALAARLETGRTVGVCRGSRVLTVDRLGEDACAGGLTDTPRAAEQIGVGQLPATDSISQGRSDVMLPHDRSECRRTILACRNYEVFHTVQMYEFFCDE